jgi:hypothetical protein
MSIVGLKNLNLRCAQVILNLAFCLLAKRLASASEVSKARVSGEDVIAGGADESRVV